MKTLNDTLIIRQGTCPPACRACVDACANRKHGDGVAVINSVKLSGVNFQGVLTCNQCSLPACSEICPGGAIKRDAGGVVRIDRQRCSGCGLCTLACPYGGITYQADLKKTFKCDYCAGSPRCVEACPDGVLSFAKSRPVVDYLQEDELLAPGTIFCAGCPAELALRFLLRVLGKEVVLFGCPGCAGAAGIGFFDAANAKVSVVSCLMTNVPSIMTGVTRYYRKVGKDVTCVAFVGDGATADIGFQPLSAAAERGENFIYICCDNEGYMNTGVQRSSTTPSKAWTSTTPIGELHRGKEQQSKNLPLLMAMHSIPYVATAAVSHLEDFAQKLRKAKSVKDGLSYIHLFSPCPTGWRSSPEEAIDLSRRAVETNYYPLWEAEHGKFSFTWQPKQVKPATEFTTRMKRFAHLTEEENTSFQALVEKRYNLINRLVKEEIIV